MTRGRDRRHMTARVVPLDSPEAGDARVSGTVTERLALVAELSRRAWELAGRPWPHTPMRLVPARLGTLADHD